jgi:hypothetical protein
MWQDIDHLTGSLKVTFEIFRDRIGHWCARRGDGKVCGTFFERDAALRFARRECRDETLLVLVLRSVGDIGRSEQDIFLLNSR